MGRETRQQRRARQRREMQHRRHKHSSISTRWSLLIGGGVIAVILVLVAGIALAKSGSGSSNSAINLTPTPAKTIDGIACNAGEQLTYHQHAHLNLIVSGKSLAIPAGIGNLENTDHECLYWLHTHGPPSHNVIHIEAPGPITPTLGSFFDVWHQPLSAQRIWTYALKPGEKIEIFVNQKPYTGDVRSIPLRRHSDITIEVGPPFVPPPKPFPFASPAVGGPY
jgi:hypothetical protein